jgi:hypothetical protein
LACLSEKLTSRNIAHPMVGLTLQILEQEGEPSPG